MTTNVLLVIFVALAAVAIVIQLAILCAIYASARRATERAAQLASRIENDVLPFFKDAHTMLQTNAPRLEQSISDLSASAAILRQKAEAMGDTADDVIDRTRLQVLRADQITSRALDHFEQTTETIRQLVDTPARHALALLRGVVVGVGEYILSRRSGE